MKSGAREALDKAIADRGTVRAVEKTRGGVLAVTVEWDRGEWGQMLPFLVERIEEGGAR